VLTLVASVFRAPPWTAPEVADDVAGMLLAGLP
jgi:hypothetical protein